MDWVDIYSCHPLKAQIIKGRLEQEDIPVILKEETVARLYGLTIDGLGQTHILVPQEFTEKASSLIEGFFS